jgi:D-cysteine desulfhydrase/L-cysteate sulfo-lyase
MDFTNNKRINLEQWPTPLHTLPRYGKEINHEDLYIKRDDISLTGLGGNKLRKLEYWLAEADDRKADIILVAGGCQSNLVRLTAAACAKTGFKCLAIHNCEEPKEYNGNLLLDKMFGAKQIFLGDVSEKKRDFFVKNKIQELRNDKKIPYYINDEKIGSLGYIHCLLEIDKQKPNLKNLVIVGAMGITASGFIFANTLLNNKYNIYVISVEYKKEKLIKILSSKLTYLAKKVNEKNIDNVNEQSLMINYKTKVYDDWMGKGWGITSEESLESIVKLARLEGIIIDHVYNAKTFAGLEGLVKMGIIKKEEPTCIIHTGGSPTIFGYTGLYNEILNNSKAK